MPDVAGAAVLEGDTRALLPVLSAHPFLKELKPEHIERIAESASIANFCTNEFLFRPGEEATMCYLLQRGRVAVELPHKQFHTIIIQTLEERSVLGWSWLVPPHEWCFGARATILTRTICLDAAHLRALVEEDQELGYQLTKRLVMVFGQRLQALRMQLLDMYRS